MPTQFGVRVRGDPVFATGTAYTKRIATEPKSNALLKRMIDVLSLEEMRWAASYLAQRIDVLNALATKTESNSDAKIRRRAPKKRRQPRGLIQRGPFI